MKKIIAVLGNATIQNQEQYDLAFSVGKAVVDGGYRMQTGGLSGVMEAASAGAKSSQNYREGDVIALLPTFGTDTANKYADILIPTGLDILRNVLVANAYAVIAVGGGAGTLCEIANAWAMKRLIVGMVGVGGWSEKLAGQRVDERIRYENIPEDCVYPAKTAEEAMRYIEKYIDRYTLRHTGIGRL